MHRNRINEKNTFNMIMSLNDDMMTERDER